jgi:Ca2+-dependent lipid-binding protein
MRDLVFNENWFYALLTVNVIEASNVPAMDLSGTSDPYCKITCEGREVSTSIIMKTLNPVWNETLAFEVSNPKSELKIEVWDYDYASSDDFIASISIPLSTLIDHTTVKKWYDLGEKKGKLSLELTYDYRFAKVWK